MKPEEVIPFAELLDATCSLLTRGQYTPSETSTEIFFAALKPHPMEAVRAAFSEYIHTGRFSPTPADILALLAAKDNRPDPEEAFTRVIVGQDEANTVVWTEEMGEAFTVARPHLIEGNTIAARMAFKEVYTRLVDEARAAHRPAKWNVLLGHDPARRVEAIQTAMAAGIAIEGADELLSLPPPQKNAAIALPAPAVGDSEAARTGKAALAALANRMKARAQEPSPDAAAREDTAMRAALTQEAVSRYVQGHAPTNNQPGA